MSLNHIATKVLNRPLLLEADYARTFFSAVLPRLNLNGANLVDSAGNVLDAEQMKTEASSYGRRDSEYREYDLRDGVAVLPIVGTLVNSISNIQPYSGMTGYRGIITRMRQAMNDPEVKGVMLDMDTPGGEVAGCFDTAQMLRSMAEETGKPLWAMANDMFCSAGMAIASAASHRLITQTAIVGSVGVLMAHYNYGKQLEEQGLDVTLIHSGMHKVEGNPYQALPKHVQAKFQAETDTLRAEFAALVAPGLGMSVDAVLATEAATYRGQEAIDVGFADELVNSHQMIQHFSDYLSSDRVTVGGSMTKIAAIEAPPVVAAPVASPVAAPVDEAQEPALGANTTQNGAQAERERIGAIMGHENAKGRQALANHLALETDSTVEAAAGVLAAAAMEESSAVMGDGTALDALMGATTQPDIGADKGGEPSAADTILQGFAAAGGAVSKLG
jgi:ClpP class serine protease